MDRSRAGTLAESEAVSAASNATTGGVQVCPSSRDENTRTMPPREAARIVAPRARAAESPNAEADSTATASGTFNSWQRASAGQERNTGGSCRASSLRIATAPSASQAKESKRRSAEARG